MFFQRYGKFTGGIDLPEEKDATLNERIKPAGGFDTLCLPLNLCGRGLAQPVVAVGDQVEPGDKIASAPPGGVDIFAPLGGVVAEVNESITIGELSEWPGISVGHRNFIWQAVNAVTLREELVEGQLTTHRRPIKPLIDWVKNAKRHNCQHLIVNAMETQPFVTAAHRLLVEYGEEVIQGMAILARAAEIGKITLAVDQQRTGDYQHLLDPTTEYGINHVALPRKYPIGADSILIHVLTRKEVPCGGGPEDIGVAVIDIATCFAAYRWLACSQRLGGRVVTISGDRAKNPGNYFVPFGVNCLDMLADTHPPIIRGGPMDGRLCDADSITEPWTDALLALDPTPPGVPSQCIRCGWCRDHCPTRLNVSALNDMYELAQIEEADKIGALSCVGCGVCSYVCPARLPLTERVRQLKRNIRRMRQSMPLFAPQKPAKSEKKR